MSCQPFFDTRPLELLMSLSSLPSSKDGYAVYPFFFTICSGVLACVLHRHTFELALLHHRSLPLMADCHYSNSWIRNPGPTLLLTAECLHKHEIKNYTHENDRIWKIITIRSPRPRTPPIFPFPQVSRHPAPFLDVKLSLYLTLLLEPQPTESIVHILAPSFLGCGSSFPFFSLPGSNSSGRLSDSSSLHAFLLSHPSNSWIKQHTFAFGLACLVLGKFELSLVLYSTHRISHRHGAWKECLGHLCSWTWFWLGLLCFACRCMERRMRRWLADRTDDGWKMVLLHSMEWWMVVPVCLYTFDGMHDGCHMHRVRARTGFVVSHFLFVDTDTNSFRAIHWWEGRKMARGILKREEKRWGEMRLVLREEFSSEWAVHSRETASCWYRNERRTEHTTFFRHSFSFALRFVESSVRLLSVLSVCLPGWPFYLFVLLVVRCPPIL